MPRTPSYRVVAGGDDAPHVKVVLERDATPACYNGQKMLTVYVSVPGAASTRAVAVPPESVCWAPEGPSRGPYVLGLVRLARVVRDGACWRGVARATSEWIEVFTVTAFQFSSEHLVQLDGTPYVPPADDLLTADAPAWVWEENAPRGDAP